MFLIKLINIIHTSCDILICVSFNGKLMIIYGFENITIPVLFNHFIWHLFFNYLFIRLAISWNNIQHEVICYLLHRYFLLGLVESAQPMLSIAFWSNIPTTKLIWHTYLFNFLYLNMMMDDRRFYILMDNQIFLFYFIIFYHI